MSFQIEALLQQHLWPCPPLPSSRGKGELFIDTHSIAKRMVKEGVSAEVAGVAASLILETVDDSFERIAKSYALQSLMEQKNADLESYFKLEIQILKAEIKGLKADIEGDIKDIKFGVVSYALGLLASLCTASIAWFFRHLFLGSRAKDV